MQCTELAALKQISELVEVKGVRKIRLCLESDAVPALSIYLFRLFIFAL